MAPTKTSSFIKNNFKYDMFLSFRGQDTAQTFVDHLYHALNQIGLASFKYDETIKKGENINNHLDTSVQTDETRRIIMDYLIRAIEDSRLHIIIFSKKYVASSWCLDELVKIMECHKTTGHTAYPIFYDVEPTEVRYQSGLVGEAFATHEENEDAKRWRDALKEAGSLGGWELKNTLDGHEAELIQNIVQDISLKLSLINWNVDGNLLGIETLLKNLVSSLEIGSEDVHMIEIKGMVSDGNTTLARDVYNHISTWFECKSFVEKVREVSKGSSSGLKELQKQVLLEVLNDPRIDVN